MADDLDERMLSLLRLDARMPLALMARELGVARTTAQARLERLERNGTIAGYTIVAGPGVESGLIRATVLVVVDPHKTASVLARLKSVPEVRAVHTTSGRFDLNVQVAARGTAVLDTCLDRIGAIDGVKSLESLIHLTTKLDRGA
jgi:DNA-binding Lrp family transcriptional regulator